MASACTRLLGACLATKRHAEDVCQEVHLQVVPAAIVLPWRRPAVNLALPDDGEAVLALRPQACWYNVSASFADLHHDGAGMGRPLLQRCLDP